MGWFIATCDMPGKPFAVVDGAGAVAGCHATREAASIQMSTLNVNGPCAETIPDAKPAPTPEPAVEPAARREEPVMYRPSATIAW